MLSIKVNKFKGRGACFSERIMERTLGRPREIIEGGRKLNGKDEGAWTEF